MRLSDCCRVLETRIAAHVWCSRNCDSGLKLKNPSIPRGSPLSLLIKRRESVKRWTLCWPLMKQQWQEFIRMSLQSRGVCRPWLTPADCFPWPWRMFQYDLMKSGAMPEECVARLTKSDGHSAWEDSKKMNQCFPLWLSGQESCASD